MTTRAHATRAALYALVHWGGRVAVLRRDVTLGTEWLILSSHSANFRGREVNEHWRFVTTAQVGDSVMVGGYEAVVVEIWEG